MRVQMHSLRYITDHGEYENKDSPGKTFRPYTAEGRALFPSPKEGAENGSAMQRAHHRRALVAAATTQSPSGSQSDKRLRGQCMCDVQ